MKTHQKRNDEWTHCGIFLMAASSDIVELPEEVTCKKCLRIIEASA